MRGTKLRSHAAPKPSADPPAASPSNICVVHPTNLRKLVVPAFRKKKHVFISRTTPAAGSRSSGPRASRERARSRARDGAGARGLRYASDDSCLIDTCMVKQGRARGARFRKHRFVQQDDERGGRASGNTSARGVARRDESRRGASVVEASRQASARAFAGSRARDGRVERRRAGRILTTTRYFSCPCTTRIRGSTSWRTRRTSRWSTRRKSTSPRTGSYRRRSRSRRSKSRPS